MPGVYSVRSVVFVIGLSLIALVPGTASAEASKANASLLFADAHSKQRFDAYRAYLDSDPTRFAAALATIEQLERSEIQYVVSVGDPLGAGVEGLLSTDGVRALIRVADFSGPRREVTSLVARFAHEFEHARQFDAGELALARNPATGAWSSHYSSYDIGDEVKAWKAQLAVAEPNDYWYIRDGAFKPTLLRLFANAATDAARAQVLVQHGYADVNPTVGSALRFNSDTGFVAGQVIRPDASLRRNLFGRVFGIVADKAARVVSAGSGVPRPWNVTDGYDLPSTSYSPLLTITSLDRARTF